MKRIVIIGAGPTGLSAALRLKNLGHKDFIVYERNNYVGGLCASFKDGKGFTWDLGGHVIFSRYKYFSRLFEKVLENKFLEHRRQAWIRTLNRWIPYPFQNNIRHLPKNVIEECLAGHKSSKEKPKKLSNFQDWIIDSFGEGIAKYFMYPYNFKVWAHPLSLLGINWISDRVSKVELEDLITHLESNKDNTEWGPNATFRYPLNGGTGEIFRKMGEKVTNNVRLNSNLKKIDLKRKRLYFSDGKMDDYDILINTAPLDNFVKKAKELRHFNKAVSQLKHNSVFVVGLGINKPCPSNKCWIYFPESDSPFFRVTYLSNYSPNNVPNSKNNYSLLCESAYSRHKKEDKSKIIERTIEALIKQGLLKQSDRKFIVSTFLSDVDYAYPVPTIARDRILKSILPKLEKMGVYSRGRFGAWKYEVGNTDHSVMQGKEVIDRIFDGKKEKVFNG